MLFQVLFSVIGLFAILFIGHACYGLMVTHRAAATATPVTAPASRYYGARLVTGICLAILSFVGLRWARQRRPANQKSGSV